jgi:hypothetical protein
LLKRLKRFNLAGMSECRFCKKEIEQPAGKRAKEFCNNTCRSNYWYDKNKKGKTVIKVNQPTNEKKIEPPKTTDTTINTISSRPFMNDAIRKKLGIK